MPDTAGESPHQGCVDGPARGGADLILWLVTGNVDWFVLIGVLLLLGVTLDSAIYVWAVKWQPPWMTGILALVELGLLLILASVLKLDIAIVEGIIFYIGAWLLFVFTKIVLLPIFSLTYVESAGEFRTTEWSIPAGKESLPLIAATEGGQGAPGRLLLEASGAHAIRSKATRSLGRRTRSRAAK